MDLQQAKYELSKIASRYNLFSSTFVLPKEINLEIEIISSTKVRIKSISISYQFGLTFRIYNHDDFFIIKELSDKELKKVLDYIHSEFIKPNIINILPNNETAEIWFETKDGKKLLLPRYFLNHIDLDNNIFYLENSCNAAINLPTLADLVNSGLLIEKRRYNEVISHNQTFRNIISIKRIQSHFKKYGHKVTE